MDGGRADERLGDELNVPTDTIAFHANWTVGVENKAKMLDMVWNNLRPGREICARGKPARIRRRLRRREDKTPQLFRHPELLTADDTDWRG
jgi:hypothetical protein